MQEGRGARYSADRDGAATGQGGAAAGDGLKA